jgi:hypothetical protein
MRKLTTEELESVERLRSWAASLDAKGHHTTAKSIRQQADDMQHNLEHDEDETVLKHRMQEAIGFFYEFKKEVKPRKLDPTREIEPYVIHVGGRWKQVAQIYKMDATDEYAVRLLPQKIGKMLKHDLIAKNTIIDPRVKGREVFPFGVRIQWFILDKSIASSRETIPYTRSSEAPSGLRVCDLWDYVYEKDTHKSHQSRRFDNPL